MKGKIEGYKKLIQVIDDYGLEKMLSAKRDAEKHVFIEDFEEKYHIVIDFNKLSLGSGVWTNLSVPIGDMGLGTYGEKYGRKVFNNKQDTEEEILLNISFPTGPYVFGEDYPKEFFGRFYSELKTYGPKYCDDLNNSLYFSMDNAAKFFNSYRAICDKYIKENHNDFMRRRAEKLREEAERIEAKLKKEVPQAGEGGQ